VKANDPSAIRCVVIFSRIQYFRTDQMSPLPDDRSRFGRDAPQSIQVKAAAAEVVRFSDVAAQIDNKHTSILRSANAPF